MATFQFRLATLLRLREATRDDRRAQLAEALYAEQLIVERIVALDAELADLKRQSLDAARPGRVNVDRLTDGTRYEMILKVERQTADQQRQAVADEVRKRREALVAADRDVKVFEKLRDTQAEQHRDEEARRESKRLDEIAVVRHATQEAV